MKNPFKFGTIVDDQYFIARKKEVEKVAAVLAGENHLVVISPRGFGKSSLIFKAVRHLERPVIAIDMQLVTGPTDLAAQILKRIYRLYPSEKLNKHLKKFRVIPTLNLNPVTEGVDVAFMPGTPYLPALEDVLDLAEKVSTAKKKIIMIFDEFQDAVKLHPDMLHQLRAIMQHHTMVNYIFPGSQESLIREIFQKKKSPFYHFGNVLNLSGIGEQEFREFLADSFKDVCSDPDTVALKITGVTRCHPYYTQQLAFTVWERAMSSKTTEDIVSEAVDELIMMHDIDYERIWVNFNKTDRKMLTGLSVSDLQPLSDAFYRTYGISASSTAFSSLKRLMADGYITKVKGRYEIDDPFFNMWLKRRRER